MPVTLSSSINMALRSMQVTQTSLGTVAHNIANVNSEGYSRQEILTKATAYGGLGNGVEIGSIRSVMDPFLVASVTNQLTEMGYANAVNKSVMELETIFGTPGSSTSMENQLNQFFNELNNLSGYPDSTSQRQAIITKATFLIDGLHQINNTLDSIQSRIDERINEEISTVNEALINISELNTQIVSVEIGGVNGENSNDLRDERQRQINIVAQRLPINITEGDNGNVRVLTTTGRLLVDQSYAQLERTAPIAPSTFQDISLRPVNQSGVPSTKTYSIQTDRMSNGSFKGLIDARDIQVVNLMDELDNFAVTFMAEFNRIHSQGIGSPPPNTLTGGNGRLLSGVGADLVTELGMADPIEFDISVVDPTNGAPIVTTLSTPITVAGPVITLADIVNAINTDPNIGADVTASVVFDTDGNPQLEVATNDPARGIVMNNITGDMLGDLGMNNFFTGTDASDIDIRADIATDSTLIATAKMRASDGGLSLNDNRNVITLGQMADTTFSFAAAGKLAAQTDSISGYYISITAGLAVTIADNQDRVDFGNIVLDDLSTRAEGVSGVNMDEELANLLIYQNAFQASARIVSVMDELLETVINLV